MRRGRGKQIDTIRSTGHPALDLLAAAVSRAIADAKRGDLEAADWLADVCPSWRRYDQQKALRRVRRRSR